MPNQFMRLALRLAARGYGATSPNPMVGAVLVKGGKIIGRGWHHRAGGPHAEIEALRDAERRGNDVRGATLYVSLEPCSTHGRTPPCTEALIKSGVGRVVVAATDPNPAHAGRGFTLLKRAGISVEKGLLAEMAARLNEAFNHWIVHRTPFVVVKAAMTLDGKIATARGESKWITGPEARAAGMRLRLGTDAVLVGINTVLADNPSLTWRPGKGSSTRGKAPEREVVRHPLRRIVLDAEARTPLKAKVVSDAQAGSTIIVVSDAAPKSRVEWLSKRVTVWRAPLKPGKRGTQRGGELPPRLDLVWLLKRLGRENITSLLVEGGGEVNGSFLLQGLAHRVAFFYAPKILGGRDARKAVAGDGAASMEEILNLTEIEWKQLGEDWLFTARVTRQGKPRQRVSRRKGARRR